jgi:hypothetical protein
VFERTMNVAHRLIDKYIENIEMKLFTEEQSSLDPDIIHHTPSSHLRDLRIFNTSRA